MLIFILSLLIIIILLCPQNVHVLYLVAVSQYCTGVFSDVNTFWTWQYLVECGRITSGNAGTSCVKTGAWHFCV